MDQHRGGKWHTTQINIVQIQTSLSDVSYGNSAFVIIVCTRSASNNVDDIEMNKKIRIIQRGHMRV